MNSKIHRITFHPVLSSRT